jgi:SAM-dependent methyltransferase
MLTLKALRREAQRKIRQVGVWGTARHAVVKMGREVSRMLAIEHCPKESFDSRYGTDTAGVLGVGSLDIPDDRMEHAIQYAPISEDEFDRLIDNLPIVAEELTFLDLGSGKGRALLLASRFKFKRVIGVELSRELHLIAVHNIEVFDDQAKKCGNIQSIHGDAASVELPLEPLLCFMFHPFDDYVMRDVLARIGESLRKQPRPLYVLYIRPDFKSVLDCAPFLTLVRNSERYVFYEARCHPVLRNGSPAELATVRQ